MQKYSREEIINQLYENGYTYLSGNCELMTSRLLCLDKNGYYVFCVPSKIFHTKKRPRIIDASNSLSLLNIKRIIRHETNRNFICVSQDYKDNISLLGFVHLLCGTKFNTSWRNLIKKREKSKIINCSRLVCPICNTKQLESTHALVLKQVWLHEHIDTIVEDMSCVNPNTHHVLPTDIVNHRLKIAIEIQSQFHDTILQQKKDKVKKEYWIKRGYSFYSIDQRDYTVLEMIKMFFPNIISIPNYIDFSYSNKFDDIKAQRLLNNYMSVYKVAKKMKCDSHRIYDAIQYKRISYPKGYVSNRYTKVVQLDINGNYISTYNSLSEIKKFYPKINPCNISSCLSLKRNYSSGYYWVKFEDYKKGDYNICKYRSSKFSCPINQYNLNNIFIKRYESIISASRENNVNNSDIYRVAIGQRKTCNNFIWKFDS